VTVRGKQGDYAWAVLIAGAAAYSLVAPRTQLLCEAAARHIEAHPIAARFAIIATAAHVARVVPTRLDLFHGCGLADPIMTRWVIWRRGKLGW
jgi:hypothetical protein